MHPIIYILIGIVICLAGLLAFWSAKRFKEKLELFILSSITDKTNQQKDALEKWITIQIKTQVWRVSSDYEQKFFNRLKANLPQFDEKMLANLNENVQNESGGDDRREKRPDFWHDLDRMRALRDELAENPSGADYQSISKLEGLPPLDAWRTLDEAIVQEEHNRTL